MRKLAGILLGLPLVMSVPGLAAQSVFNGTWKMDVQHAIVTAKPEVFTLRFGVFQCLSCNPILKVDADGKDQPVTGRKDADSIAIKVVDEHEVAETIKKDGKVVFEGTSTVSSDGNMLNRTFTIYPANGAPLHASNQLRRIGKKTFGAHLIAGTWGGSALHELPTKPESWTFNLNGTELSSASSRGSSYRAKVNGPEAPVTGNIGASTVMVKLVDKSTLEETYKRDGAVVAVTRIHVKPDGSSAMCTQKDPSGWSVEAPCIKQ
ncbi:MAG TPA: hypothetical protein VGL22_16675 [Terracidiphilus sp.]|jgi:hypothetical protein